MLVQVLTYSKIFLAICILSFTTKGLSNENDKKQNSDDEVFRSDSSYAEVEMIVKNENWERTMEIEIRGQKEWKTLITIRSPKKMLVLRRLKLILQCGITFQVNKIMEGPTIHDDGILDGYRYDK